MAPTSIAIHRHKEDPVSPIPVRKEDFPKSSRKTADEQATELDKLNQKFRETKEKMERMRREKLENNKRLMEMSGLVKTLQDIPVGHDRHGNTFNSVQQKIQAIASEMEEAKKKYDLVSKTKDWHNDTIESQVEQVEYIEEQIRHLNERLRQEESEQRESKKETEERLQAKTEDLEQRIILLDMEIMNLMGEIDMVKMKKDSSDDEIQQMEVKLEKMKKEQKLQKFQHEAVLDQQERSGFVLKPTDTAFAEITELEDKLTNLRLEQEMSNIFGEKPTSEKSLTSNQASVSSRRQTSNPWSRDLARKDAGLGETELAVVAANTDIDYDDPISLGSVSEDQNPLSIPSLSTKKNAVKSLRPNPFGGNSTTDESESESESEASLHGNIQSPTKDRSHSDTSATDSASTSSLSSPASDTSSSDDDTYSSCLSTIDEHQKSRDFVELTQSDDGSVEMQLVMSESTDESEGEYTSGASVSEGSTHGESSNESSTDDEYTSGESTESESRSILEKIPEEGESEESESESEAEEQTLATAENELVAKDQQIGNLVLVQQLKESQDKYVKLMEHYNGIVVKTHSKMTELEKENEHLRNDQNAEGKIARSIREENKMLLNNMARQDELMMRANKDYEELRMEHASILKELEEKQRQYDHLLSESFKKAKRGKDTESYARLEALHEKVVMKLADMGEDNDKLEKERDDAIRLLENNIAKIRGYDEAIAELNEVRANLRNLQEVHEETVEELQELAFKNRELKEMYDREAANGEHLEILQHEHANVKAELEVLKQSNNGFSGVEGKLNQSEVRVTMLEEELKKTKDALSSATSKSNAREGQLKDVIVQYKSLKKEHADKSAKLARLELAVDGLEDDKTINEMKSMEREVDQAKKEAQDAIKAKQAREDDMRVVLQHYEKLQRKYEKLQAKYDYETEDHEKQLSALSLKVDEKKEDDDCNRQHELEALLEESKDSLTWRDEKISQFASDLGAAKEQIEQLEKEKKELEVELSSAKSELLLARKEANNAETRKGSGEDRLKSAIADHNRLQQTYSSLLNKFGTVKAELENTKKEAKSHEEAEKDARKRVATVEGQYKQLQADHNVVVERLEKLKVEMTTFSTDSEQ